jgi:hypothetical protein
VQTCVNACERHPDYPSQLHTGWLDALKTKQAPGNSQRLSWKKDDEY